MLNRINRRLWQDVLIAALTSGLLSAQMTVTGTISGSVTDPSGQAIASAKVTATSTTTSEPRTAAANEVGAFNLVALQPGTYNIRVEHPGFRPMSEEAWWSAPMSAWRSATWPCRLAT